jgi:hypothetical protein
LHQHADKAQQAFSFIKTPSLHNALPAIEALYAAWSKRAEKVKYSSFQEALDAATSKLDEYYQKTASSDAHILAMGKFTSLFSLPAQFNSFSSTSWQEDASLPEILEL